MDNYLRSSGVEVSFDKVGVVFTQIIEASDDCVKKEVVDVAWSDVAKLIKLLRTRLHEERHRESNVTKLEEDYKRLRKAAKEAIIETICLNSAQEKLSPVQWSVMKQLQRTFSSTRSFPEGSDEH